MPLFFALDNERAGRVDRPDLVLLERLDRLGAQRRREIDQIVVRDPLLIECRRLVRKRLRRRRPLFRHVRLRDRPSRSTATRAAVGAVEHIGERLLCELHDRANRLAVHRQVDEDRVRGHVVVPDVVVHELLVPDHLAGLDVEADQRVRVQVVAGTMAAVHVVGRRFDAQVHVAQLRVGGERPPDAGVAGVLQPNRPAMSRCPARPRAEWCGTSRASCPCARRSP